jgi:uncharacterized protein (TIGR02145 family)
LLDKVEGSTAFTVTQIGVGWGGLTAGKLLKSAGTHTGTDPGDGSWLNDATRRGADSFSFGVTPAGDRELEGSTFVDRGRVAYYWTSSVNDDSHSWRRRFDYNDARVNVNNSHRSYGFAIRCIQD